VGPTPNPRPENSTPEGDWPRSPGEAAFDGLPGDFVRAVEPHSEADRTALLLQLLVAVGNLIGRGPYFTAEGDRHHTNIFAVLVGKTSKSRKGTSLGRVRQVLGKLDEEWAAARIVSGLSSGEGLIHAVRDPVRGTKDGKDVIVDTGVTDKRLLAVQTEFGSTLRVLGRDGNTLSATIRDAWDRGDLGTLTKTSAETATGAHIAIIAHITQAELLRHLSETEQANGFANRFLWAVVQRSKFLPDGGAPDPETMDVLTLRLAEAVAFARSMREIRRDDEARALWHEVYPAVSADHPGLVGAVTGRAEAQAMRLGLLYAVLDRSPVIGRRHLRSGLSLWNYCQRSARFIFRDVLGDPTADRILAALRNADDGLTGEEIHALFGRHLKAAEINRALGVLLEHGLVTAKDEQTGGRRAKRWHMRREESEVSEESREPGSEESEKSEASPVSPDLSSHKSLTSHSNGETNPLADDSSFRSLAAVGAPLDEAEGEE
jgi:hypothetical protein